MNIPVEIQPKEKINSPSHYHGATSDHEVWKCLESWGLHERSAYAWNAVKYLARAGKKDGEKALDDVKKSFWYIQKEIARLERKEGTK